LWRQAAGGWAVGRAAALTEDEAVAAVIAAELEERELTDPAGKPKDIARELGVTTTTLYEYVNGDGLPKAAAEAALRGPPRP
jgi:hypothetical protein